MTLKMKLEGKLTKYSSFEALKNDRGSEDADSARVAERHQAFEKLMEFLRKEFVKSQTNADKNPSK